VPSGLENLGLCRRVSRRLGGRGWRGRFRRGGRGRCCLSCQLIAVEAGAAPHVGWAAFGGASPCAIDSFIEERECLFAASEQPFIDADIVVGKKLGGSIAR